MTSPDPARAAFEAWFASVYGPPPSDAQILASLADAARLEAFMGGAWAAWQRCHAYLSLSPDDTRSPGDLVVANMTPSEVDVVEDVRVPNGSPRHVVAIDGILVETS